jgi:hypothetical protein
MDSVVVAAVDMGWAAVAGMDCLVVGTAAAVGMEPEGLAADIAAVPLALTAFVASERLNSECKGF